MHSILNELQELANADLYALCEAVWTMELQPSPRGGREEIVDEAPASARHRAQGRRGEGQHRRRNVERRLCRIRTYRPWQGVAPGDAAA